MLSLKQTLRDRKSRKRFIQMENQVLEYLLSKKMLTGNYGKSFNELSYRLSNIVELITLRYVKDKAQDELIRRFSPNPDLFHFAKEKGLQTSTYLLFQSKNDEAKDRILNKIEGFLIEEISKNPSISSIFDIVHGEITEILKLRYPEFFIDNLEEVQAHIDALLKGKQMG